MSDCVVSVNLNLVLCINAVSPNPVAEGPLLPFLSSDGDF